MLHNPHDSRSVRFPIGGGLLIRFDFHVEIGGPGWVCTISLPGQSRALYELSYGAKLIRQPELHRSLADTSGVRRSQRFGGILKWSGTSEAAAEVLEDGEYLGITADAWRSRIAAANGARARSRTG